MVRRLFGETIPQAQYSLGNHDQLVSLVVSVSGGLSQLGSFVDRLQRILDHRMHKLKVLARASPRLLVERAGGASRCRLR